jgi:hypothetical protein
VLTSVVGYYFEKSIEIYDLLESLQEIHQLGFGVAAFSAGALVVSADHVLLRRSCETL